MNTLTHINLYTHTYTHTHTHSEFTYQMLQAYDFLHLKREHGVSVQVGGQDQWGIVKCSVV
jgi:tyrosyl-tRNA synthetase